ncbi:MAG: MFS transporter [Proteobacteria bacterium]|nr:MFS transporter [Pseudomonadota bacterium]MBU1390056.1 MFS transporter [Pseudomonadota bacterium]MBU1544993.1 MFS transporter [Pseudomonadota bacterium]MBU2430555.1 MFS transporter [Pseudomonadota bacterium]MBU2480975.1 MFS transporter [Pseudomonadota bacterium]
MTQKKYSYIVFGILGISYILVFFHRLSPAVMAVDIMKDLNTGGAVMGILSSAYFYPYAIMQIPAGLLSDSWGPRRSVSFFLLIAAIGSMAFGLSQNVGMAIAARGVVGLGVAMVFVPTMKILTNWFESRQFVHLTGILISLGGVGAYTAATPLAFLSEALNWRASMIIIGFITIAVAFFVWQVVRDTPAEKGYLPVKNISSTPDMIRLPIGLLQGLLMVIKSPRFWPMAVCFFLSAAVSLTFMGLWGGPFLMQVYGMTKSQTGAILSMMAIGLIVGAPVMSWLSEHVYKSRKMLMVSNLIASFFLFSLLAFFTGDFPVPFLYLWCFVYSFLGAGSIVVGYVIIKDIFPLEIAGTATGLVNIAPFAGAAIGQPLMGWYLDSFGSTAGVYSVYAYSCAFKFCLVFILGAVMASVLIKENS